jgi:2-polyprenyl-3-methyl-5-hydroxy-6-metoxy-1,4-benzoquinol methylase
MDRLLPDELRQLWSRVEAEEISWEEFEVRKDRLLDDYRRVWAGGLLLKGQVTLADSLRAEFDRYVADEVGPGAAPGYETAADAFNSQWSREVDPQDGESIERFYRETQSQLGAHLQWHSLSDDETPLAYVVALEFAKRHNCRSLLDFGAGVGSGGIVFARQGFAVTLADISAPNLAFCEWRFRLRGLPCELINLVEERLPNQAFDLVTVMDVFEHLVDPVDTVTTLHTALKPGGYLFGRFNLEEDDEAAGHIVRDFRSTFARIEELGLRHAWFDDWLWGHDVFQRPST